MPTKLVSDKFISWRFRFEPDANAASEYDASCCWNLEYVEQPCSTVEELAAVRRIVAVPIAADESIRRADDPLRVAKLDAADIVVLKVAPLGGDLFSGVSVTQTLELTCHARCLGG